MHRCAAVLAPWLLAGAAAAQDPAPGSETPPAAAAVPTVQLIGFEGNATTRPEVMRREMVIAVGDPADPARIERSRQGIQDLGLFRSVKVRQVPVAGGVALTFIVEEKWYILPIPRLDANSEGENAYGMSLRWFNVGGRNHTLRGSWAREDEAKVNKGESTSYGMSYVMPFVYDSPWGIGVGASHSETPITEPAEYTETIDSVGVGLSRSFADGPASQGWSTTLSLAWTRQDTQGPNALAPYGRATTLGLGATYRDVRDNIYSEEGITYGARVRGASEGLASDYGFGSVQADVTRYFLVGETPHQSVNLIGGVGSYHGGPTEHQTTAGAFNLGGASRMRAYPADFVVGDFYYHFAAEYARPLFADWLRPVVVLELGNAFEDASHIDSRVYASVGLGLRVRLTFLVSVEIEAGFAWPLGDDGERRFFASKV